MIILIFAIINMFMNLNEWININKINWNYLSANKNAIKLLK
jgi:hypothetical protein